ncbi:MAG: Oligopeptide transport ATP-binding protein OppF [uncultured Thermomicrobiales bacterium]|uniref:Oligopeptide transport ATP-binding protein OppF n=1 Tax=uncultured Thermomicrobiales bacterium TaxID=1645740 RepID=A0A6J4UWI9_9BACT|nr:MAG: Oligopeptide transport ATP-binding protein OppF [uncultured Thermomicrobiales bacterium]
MAEATEAPILSLQGLGMTFRARGEGRRAQTLRAVDGVDLDVGRGRVVGLVGESGCGKSTLARTIVRLETPTDGRVLYEGTDVHALAGRDLAGYRREVQLVFQDPYAALPPRMRCGEAIGEPLRIHRRGDTAGRRRRTAELLDLVGLPRVMGDRYPHQLSGGQRQRINIARALALEPKLLVLDEPVSALDVSIQGQVLNLLGALRRDLGLTYLFISHDLRVVRYLCDEVAVMYLGRLVEFGPTEEVFARPNHPYTLALIRSIPDHEREGLGGRVVLRGEVPNPIDRPPGCPFHTRCPMARDVCAREVPPLRPVGAGNHRAACHFAEEVSDAAMVAGRNRAAGLP